MSFPNLFSNNIRNIFTYLGFRGNNRIAPFNVEPSQSGTPEYFIMRGAMDATNNVFPNNYRVILPVSYREPMSANRNRLFNESA